MKILAVDPGEKHLGIAISDPTAAFARPLTVLQHISRLIDAASIASLAREHEVGMIVIGKPISEDGLPTQQTRHADSLAKEILQQLDIPVIFWDESLTTQDARRASIIMGTSRKKRRGHLDEIAATVLLQSFLDANLGKSYVIEP